MPMPVCPARLAGLLISGRVPVVARDASWRGVQVGVVDDGAGDAGILRIDTPYWLLAFLPPHRLKRRYDGGDLRARGGQRVARARVGCCWLSSSAMVGGNGQR